MGLKTLHLQQIFNYHRCTQHMVPSLHCFNPKFVLVLCRWQHTFLESKSSFWIFITFSYKRQLTNSTTFCSWKTSRSLAFFGFPIEFLQNKQCNLYMQVPLFLARTGMCTPMRTCVLWSPTEQVHQSNLHRNSSFSTQRYVYYIGVHGHV